MINTIAALQGLYVALGGDIGDVANINTIPDMLEAISTVAASAAGELPPVTGSDNGNVLTVVSGKWAKAAVPKELPTVAGADNGDVLTVVEGAWAKAEIPAELPAVTGDDNGKILAVANGAWALGTLTASASLETGAVTFTFTPDT